MDNLLKWAPAIAGLILFVTGLTLKIIQGAMSYEEFIMGNSYIILVIGIQAMLLNFAFNHILSDSNDYKE